MHEDDHWTAPAEQQSSEPNGRALGTITLRQVRVNRADVQDKSKDANLMNRLVPYLDLYGRLSDEELGRLASVPSGVVADLRRQVIQVDRALARFADLLPRLTDAEMVRLTGATPKTIRFWRLCQPRFSMTGNGADGWSVAEAAESLGRVRSSAELIHRPPGTGSARGVEGGLESGIPGDGPADPEARTAKESRRRKSETHAAAEPRASESGVYALPQGARRNGTGESARSSGSKYRMPTAERDGRASTPANPANPGTGTPGWPAPAPPASSKGPPRPPPARSRAKEGSETASPGSTGPTTDARLKQEAVAQQMKFSGAPFPGPEAEATETAREDDGIFIGLELPDPRTLAQPGRRD